MREAPAHIPKNGKSYHIHTFGCQMNLADSERMAGVLESVSRSSAAPGCHPACTPASPASA